MPIVKVDVTTRLGYDIATALRGPDGKDTILRGVKYLLTSRLRFLCGVGEGEHVPCLIRKHAAWDDTGDLELQRWPSQHRGWFIGIRHCLDHLLVAFRIIAYSHADPSIPSAILAEAEALADVAEALLAYAYFCAREKRYTCNPGEQPYAPPATTGEVDVALLKLKMLTEEAR